MAWQQPTPDQPSRAIDFLSAFDQLCRQACDFGTVNKLSTWQSIQTEQKYSLIFIFQFQNTTIKFKI